jgi:mRNA-degrading endonuclease RelE of RelBE toxin-antitoxin system
MKYEFKPSFEQSLKALPERDKQAVKNAALRIIDILSKQSEIRHGIGLKRLRNDLWEARYGLQTRIILRLTGDLVEFILAGNHDQVRRFLRNV